MADKLKSVKNPEARKFLNNIDSACLMGLYELSKNKKLLDSLLFLTDSIKNRDFHIVLEKAGAAKSMDSMIDLNTEQSFRRGRISFAVLLETILVNSGKQVENIESGHKQKS